MEYGLKSETGLNQPGRVVTAIDSESEVPEFKSRCGLTAVFFSTSFFFNLFQNEFTYRLVKVRLFFFNCPKMSSFH